MSSLYGDNVFCQSNLDVTTSKTKWIDGPCNIHSIYVIPNASVVTEPGYLDFYSGDPDSAGIIRLSVPLTYSPQHTMQGAINIKIPLNGIRFEDTVYAKLSGASLAEPDCTMVTYTGAREDILAS